MKSQNKQRKKDEFVSHTNNTQKQTKPHKHCRQNTRKTWHFTNTHSALGSTKISFTGSPFQSFSPHKVRIVETLQEVQSELHKRNIFCRGNWACLFPFLTTELWTKHTNPVSALVQKEFNNVFILTVPCLLYGRNGICQYGIHRFVNLSVFRMKILCLLQMCRILHLWRMLAILHIYIYM